MDCYWCTAKQFFNFTKLSPVIYKPILAPAMTGITNQRTHDIEATLNFLSAIAASEAEHGDEKII
jgi:hypothetical protein